ncbi:MAG: helix-turn-helix transcriptional regulator [Gammaproteobacteria bacterium]
MGKAKSNDTLARQWQLLKELPKGPPGVTPRDLTDKLESFRVDKRTVERDLVSLSRIFPLCCNNKGVPHGWYWMAGKGLNLPALTVQEALSLHLMEQYLKSLLPASVLTVLAPHFEEANRKLAELTNSNTVAAWTDKVRIVPPSLPLLPPVIAEGVLESVQEALLNDLQIECAYQSAGAEAPEARRLHPLALVQRGPVMYLVATASNAPQVKLYVLHRFRKVEITEAPIVRPKGFNIDTYIAKGNLQFGNGKTLKLKASIDEDLAAHLAETPLSEDVRIVERDEDYLLTATVADSLQLRWWLLSWGSAVEVLGPKGLRGEISGRVRDMYSVYGLPPESE